MFRNIKLILVVSLLVLLAAAPIIAAEKGSVNLDIKSALFVAGSELQPGKYNVQWKTDGTETTVTFFNKGKAAATVQGKIAEVDKAFDYNSFLSGKDSSGHLAINEIQLGGKKFKIVLE